MNFNKINNFLMNECICHLIILLFYLGGATGDIIMDHNADRIPDYWLFDMQGSGMFAIAAETISSEVNASVQRVWLLYIHII